MRLAVTFISVLNYLLLIQVWELGTVHYWSTFKSNLLCAT